MPEVTTENAVARQIEFEYGLGDQVRIRDYPDITARVVGLCLRVWGKTYCVCWWDSGKRYEEWVHDWEIERSPQ